MRLLTATLPFHPGQLWGLWLYTGLVFTVLILEVVAFAIRARSSQQDDLSTVNHDSF